MQKNYIAISCLKINEVGLIKGLKDFKFIHVMEYLLILELLFGQRIGISQT